MRLAMSRQRSIARVKYRLSTETDMPQNLTTMIEADAAHLR
jgi:hypothetical protein